VTGEIMESAGLGVTEFFLMLMAWLCFRNDHYKNSQICIVTGPNPSVPVDDRPDIIYDPLNTSQHVWV
jgi:hypothetical protein